MESQDRYRQGWEKLKEVDGEAGERVIESMGDIVPDFVRYLIELRPVSACLPLASDTTSLHQTLARAAVGWAIGGADSSTALRADHTGRRRTKSSSGRATTSEAYRIVLGARRS